MPLRRAILPMLTLLVLGASLPPLVEAGPSTCQLSVSAPVCEVRCVTGQTIDVSAWNPAIDHPEVGVAVKCRDSGLVTYCDADHACSASGVAPVTGLGDCFLLGGSGPLSQGTCDAPLAAEPNPPCPDHPVGAQAAVIADSATLTQSVPSATPAGSGGVAQAQGAAVADCEASVPVVHGALDAGVQARAPDGTAGAGGCAFAWTSPSTASPGELTRQPPRAGLATDGALALGATVPSAALACQASTPTPPNR
ncbi:MAG: hypothetical protein QOE90_448 [Thermoplasmata archaeon]|jgi:hypothetical protein|nr:hypothetical protein [Thermoplasmata archaeon]